jgi:hypothetical protein
MMGIEFKRKNGNDINKENSYPVNPLNPVHPVKKKMSDTTEIVTRFSKTGGSGPVPRLVFHRSPVWYFIGPPSGISSVPRLVFQRSDG